MAKMRAVVIEAFGGPDQFKIAEVERPAPGPGQLLIRPAATSVNPIDMKIRAGSVGNLGPAFPAILHGDVSGTVVESGAPGLFENGDRVVGFAGGVAGHPGALAELSLLDVRAAAKVPQSVPDLEAIAALPVAGVTAWEAAVRRVSIVPGMRVLVQGGTGGVGHLAVQLAAMRGAEVSTTVSTNEKAELARSLGATNIIMYREERVDGYVNRLTDGVGFDVVIDTVGGTVLTDSFAAARAGGEVVTIAARSSQDLAALHSRALSFHAVFILLPFLGKTDFRVYEDAFPAVISLIADGRLRLHVDEPRYTFTSIGAAHAALESGAATGKIVAVNDL